MLKRFRVLQKDVNYKRKTEYKKTSRGIMLNNPGFFCT